MTRANAATASGEAIVHVWGFPWELSTAEVADVLQPMLADWLMLELPLLLLDRKGRNTGRALIRLQCDDIDAAVSALQGKQVGSRWLAVRASDGAELAKQRRAVEDTEVRTFRRAPQTYSQPTDEHTAAFHMPDDRREVVIVCHDIRAEVARGDFDINNLRTGHVDAYARCTSAEMFISHGVRQATRLWLVLRDVDITICLDGAAAKSLSPDERSLAAAIKRALWASANGDFTNVDPGWAVFPNDSLESRLRTLTGPATDLVVLHELGAPLGVVLDEATALRRRAQSSSRGDGEGEGRDDGGGDGGGDCGRGDGAGDGGSRSRAVERAVTVLVVGDNQGFTKEEEALLFDGLCGTRARVSAVPLLGSHCIILAHAVMDEAAQSGSSPSIVA